MLSASGTCSTFFWYNVAFPLTRQVPYRLLKSFQKIQTRLVRELEKKLSGKDVVIIANRRIMPKPKTGFSTARPRSRTLTAVRPGSVPRAVAWI